MGYYIACKRRPRSHLTCICINNTRINTVMTLFCRYIGKETNSFRAKTTISLPGDSLVAKANSGMASGPSCTDNDAADSTTSAEAEGTAGTSPPSKVETSVANLRISGSASPTKPRKHAPVNWRADKAVFDCFACKAPFTAINRRHHCRVRRLNLCCHTEINTRVHAIAYSCMCVKLTLIWPTGVRRNFLQLM